MNREIKVIMYEKNLLILRFLLKCTDLSVIFEKFSTPKAQEKNWLSTS